MGGMLSRGGPPDRIESKGTLWKLKSVSQPPVLMPEEFSFARYPGSAATRVTMGAVLWATGTGRVAPLAYLINPSRLGVFAGDLCVGQMERPIGVKGHGHLLS